LTYTISFVNNKAELVNSLLIRWTNFYIDNLQYEKCIKENIIEPLLRNADEKAILIFSTMLQERFVSPGSPSAIDSEDRDETSPKDYIHNQRQRYLDQLLALVKNPKISKNGQWVSNLVQFIIRHGFFESVNGKGPVPSLSEATIEWCQERLRAIMCEFLANDSKDSMPTVSIVVDTFERLNKDSSLQLAVELSQEDKAALVTAEKLRKNVAKKLSNDSFCKDDKVQFRAVQVLVLHLMVLIYLESEDIVTSIEELQECYTKMINSVGSKKKSKDDNFAPADVILDMLFSFLSRPSNLFRQLVDNVFSGICQNITPNALNLFIDVSNHPIALLLY
jgi:hypothetical protein